MKNKKIPILVAYNAFCDIIRCDIFLLQEVGESIHQWYPESETLTKKEFIRICKATNALPLDSRKLETTKLYLLVSKLFLKNEEFREIIMPSLNFPSIKITKSTVANHHFILIDMVICQACKNT
jgi:hypothetical protein